jgi:hypothetical protein
MRKWKDSAPLWKRKQVVATWWMAGRPLRLIAWATGEHVSQVQRWTRGLPRFFAKNAVAKKSGTGLESSFAGDGVKKNVVAHENFSNFFSCHNEDGEADVAVFRHPMEDMEPVEMEVRECKHNSVLAAALRYLMRQEERPMETVARELGCTRAAISRALCELSDKFGFRARNQKSERARQSYRRARLRTSNKK